MVQEALQGRGLARENGGFFFSRRRRQTICYRDWSSYVCSSDLQESENGVGKGKTFTTYLQIYGYEDLKIGREGLPFAYSILTLLLERDGKTKDGRLSVKEGRARKSVV